MTPQVTAAVTRSTVSIMATGTATGTTGTEVDINNTVEWHEIHSPNNVN